MKSNVEKEIEEFRRALMSAEFTYIRDLLDEILTANNSEKETMVSEIKESLNSIEMLSKE